MAEDVFDERKTGEEAKYKLEEERRFKVRSRRNRLYAQWAAARIGLAGEEAETYWREVVFVALSEGTAFDPVARVLGDCAARGVDLPEAEARQELSRREAMADKQIAEEFPKAFDRDHRRVGD